MAPEVQLSISNKNAPFYHPTMIKGRVKNYLSPIFFYKYETEKSKGVNLKTTNDKEDIFLAKNATKVAEYMNTLGNCYTGVKHALLTSGVINNYNEMPKGSAFKSLEYFNKRPEKFEKINSKNGKFTTEELKNLPAGHILVFSKPGLDGHIAITNGNKQGISDTFDNMRWLDEHGKNAKVSVYKLTDGWKMNSQTNKLEFKK